MDSNINNTEIKHIDIKETVKKYKIRLSKRLGQNFLTDTGVIEDIVDVAEIGKEDLVIEIGAGIGNLTVGLASKAAKVLAVEIDRYLIPALLGNTQDLTNVEILNKDILKVDLKDYIKSQRLVGASKTNLSQVKIIANLPYYITTPIIMKIMQDDLSVDLLVLMVQKEAADRIIAKTGGKDYGVMSVIVQFFYEVEKVINVPGHYFFPQPDVDSVVLKMKKRVQPLEVQPEQEMLLKVVKGAFRHRRKTIINTLSDSGFLPENKDAIREVLGSLGIEESKRAENLSILQFAKLADALSEKR